jgi:hypothetical protein
MNNMSLERREEIYNSLVEKGLEEKYSHAGVYCIKLAD